MNNNVDFITDMLAFLEPSSLEYQDWITVGMALKEEGFACSVWDEWSRRDKDRYHTGECLKKWNGFAGSIKPVTAGSIYEIAVQHGYTPSASTGAELEWDAVIGSHKADKVIVDPAWIEAQEITEPKEWNPKDELIRYLSIFESTENVGYCTEVYENDGRFSPSKGCYDRTAGELIAALRRCTDICDVIGDYNHEAGAWIRFNPLDGKGVRNENVTEFRYALVESDSMEIERQYAILRELELPCAVIVYSGKKSLHAIVHIDAADYDEYRRRVDYLYGVCQKNGLQLDKQNRNPSRLSRMPGIERGNKKQFIVDMNIGKASFVEWQEFIEEASDDLPDPETLGSVFNDLPPLAPCLIDGILRQGHKLLLSGPSKAGKSFALIELTIAIAEGLSWLGWQCAAGHVLYVNLELDRASCLHRFHDVYTKLGVEPAHIGSIDIWNLRGNTIPMDKLAPKLIRRAKKRGYIAVIIDPIYKVITGDENSAEQMSFFCNQFDKICTELSAAVIYCHHHGKGTQSPKKAIDRASGSGVFARDPDAVLDMLELEVPDRVLDEEIGRAIAAVALRYLKEQNISEDRYATSQLYSENKAHETCVKLLPSDVFRVYRREAEDVKRAVLARSGWKIEATLREFAKPDNKYIWFDYPLHRVDTSSILSDMDATNSKGSNWSAAFAKRQTPEERAENRQQSFEAAFENVSKYNDADEVPLEELAEFMGKTEKTVRKYVEENGDFWCAGGMVGRKARSDRSDGNSR